VAQKTLVLTVTAALAEKIERALRSRDFEFRRTPPHALFSVKGEDVVATCYRSGKLVVQGADPERFAAAYAGGAARATAGGASPAPEGRAEVVIGSDESGKGDLFGPLVVAAVRLTPELSRELEGGEVRDCKTMSDESVLRVGGALRRTVRFAVAMLSPHEYNAEHARVKNLNPMLAALHARAIRELAQPGDLVVVDQFADESVLARALAGVDVRLEQRHRGEEVLAVAAASVIAREEFLVALRGLSREWAVDLAKGAGEPADRAALRFVEIHGRDRLGEVAKLHFKNARNLGA
jgi:ribonuclease HIII